jgi:class 3 adenylate cyclase/tetratricopeptide (TPR) repeat protein
MTSIACPRCASANRPGRRFCAQCGARLPAACASCGFLNDGDEKFCGGCGAPLDATPGQERAHPAAVAPAETPAGTDVLAAAEGERRPVTVLFADLVGYTRFASTHDPEDVHALLSRYLDVADEIIARHGGAVDKHIGDAVMAVFGAPVAHGDEAQRAVRAAAEMQRAVPALGKTLKQPLAVHIGIATGEVVASGLGGARHRAYTVIGHSVNVAARLLDLAGPGETVLDDVAYTGAQRVARCVPIEGIRAKGIDAPLRAWRFVELAAGAPHDNTHPFVGRQAELAQLVASLESCAGTGAGGTILVRGDPGIGKSRLVEELRERARAQGFVCHTGLVLDFGMEKGRDAIRELVTSIVGLPAGADDTARVAALEAVLRNEPALGEERAYLLDLFDLPQPPDSRALYEAMDNRARQRRRARALVQLVSFAARASPLVIAVEDLHWADRLTLDYVTALARGVATVPAVLVLTSRLEGDPLDAAWRASIQGSPFLTLDVGPLATKDAVALAGRFLTAPQGYVEKCVERAAGNPLFLEQLLRAANEQDQALPASLHSLVLARMDRLPERDRAALRAAAVVGQRFPLGIVRALITAPDFTCDNLVSHFLVRPEGDEFLFAHALIRDGVYASLTRARRAELHRAAADWYGGRDPVLRAEHLDRAESPDAPRAYAEAARTQMVAAGLEQALALVDRGTAIANTPADLHTLNMLRGELRRGMGEGRPALDAYEAALAAASTSIERCCALIGMAAGQRLISGVDAAFALLDEAEPLADAEHLVRELAEIHYLRGNLHFVRSAADDCRREHEKALGYARALGNAEWEARASSGLGDADYAVGRMRSAQVQFSRCVELCEAHALPRIALPNRVMLGLCRGYLADFDGGIAVIDAARTAAVQLGDRHAEMLALESVGLLALMCNRYAIAEAAIRRGVELVVSIGARRYETSLFGGLAECALAGGRRAEAVEAVERAVAVARETGMAFSGPWVLGIQLRTLEDPHRREACMREAETLLAGAALSHNHLSYRRSAIEDALERREWPDALRHAAALEDYTRAEPLPVADFLIARARTLAGLAKRPNDALLRAEMARLRAKAERLGWPITWPA